MNLFSQLPHLHTINRMVAIIEPTQRFIDWVQSLPNPPQPPMTVEGMRSHSLIALIPQNDDPDEARDTLIATQGPSIMAQAFAGWWQNDEDWPDPQTTWKNFLGWFSVRIRDSVMDCGGPFQREEDITKRWAGR